MIALRLAEVAAVTGGRVHGDPDLVVDAVTTDSRVAVPGDALFVALRGEHADGHRYLDAARDAGASATLTERHDTSGSGVEVADTWRALRDLATGVRRRVDPRAVAVTGSVGKTTVKDLTAAAVGAGRRVTAAAGSFNNELGVPLTLLACDAATEVLVAEIGARHVGDIAELAPLVAPEVAVVTAVAGVHLEVFGTIDDVARAKAELVEALGPGGVAVLNATDPRVAAMADRAPAVLRVADPGADGTADPGADGTADPGADRTTDVVAEDVVLDDEAIASWRARTPWGTVAMRAPVAGRHQVINGLLALTVAGHLGVDLAAAADAIASATVSRWRGQVRRIGPRTVLDDAYNANPRSVTAALDTLVALRPAGARAIAVLGVMAEIGPTHDEAHAAVGRTAVALGIDQLVVVGDGVDALADGARAAGLTDVVAVADVTAAVDHLVADERPGDVVLVKASRVAGLERVADGLHAVQATGGAA